jgi:hypothetical protein
MPVFFAQAVLLNIAVKKACIASRIFLIQLLQSSVTLIYSQNLFKNKIFVSHVAVGETPTADIPVPRGRCPTDHLLHTDENLLPWPVSHRPLFPPLPVFSPATFRTVMKPGKSFLNSFLVL